MAFSILNGNKFRAYTTIDGDRWDTIALKAYGDASKFDPIIQSNFGVPLTPQLKGGVKLRIPVIESQPQTDQDLLPPWKRVPSQSTIDATNAAGTFLNPSISPGGFDESFD